MFQSIIRFFCGSKASSKQAAPKQRPIRRNSLGLGFDTLEDRINPAPVLASYAQQALPLIQTVAPVQSNITVAKITETTLAGFAPTAVKFNAPLGNFGAMSFNLGIDYNKDGVIDYPNVSGTAPGPVATATLPIPGWVQSLSTSYPSMNLVVTATTQGKSPGYVGVNVASVDFSTLWGSPVPNQYVQRTGNYPSYLYVLPNAHGALSVTGQSLGSGTTAVSNQNDVLLYREQVRATGDNIRLYQQTFVAATGTVNDFTRFSFGVDSNVDGIIDQYLAQNVAPSAGKVVFNTNYVIPNGATANLIVTGTVAPSRSYATFQLSPDTTANGVHSEDVDDGRDQIGIRVNNVGTGEISLTTVAGPTISFRNQGSLIVTASSTPVRPQYLLGGTRDTIVQRITFTALDEAVDVTDIHLVVNLVGYRSIDRFDLYKEGSLTPFASATIGGLGSDPTPFANGVFAAKMQSGQLVVGKGMQVNVIVKAVMKTDVDGMVSGDLITVELPSGFAGYQPVKARGAQSFNNLSRNNGNMVTDGEVIIGNSTGAPDSTLASPAFYAVGSRIDNVTNANPDANGSIVPLGVSNIGQFKFTAAPNFNSKNGLNDVLIDELTFSVTAANVGIDASSFRLFNKADMTTYALPSSVTLIGNTYTVKFSNLPGTWVNSEIDQGTNQTFVLQANVTNNKVSSVLASALQVTLLTDLIKWVDVDGILLSPLFIGLGLPDNVVKSTLYIG